MSIYKFLWILISIKFSDLWQFESTILYNYLSIPFSFLCIFLYFCLLGGYFEYNSERILIVFFYKSKKLLVKKRRSEIWPLVLLLVGCWLLVVGCWLLVVLWFLISTLLISAFWFLISVFCFLLSALCSLLSAFYLLLSALLSALCLLLSALCLLLSAFRIKPPHLLPSNRIRSDTHQPPHNAYHFASYILKSFPPALRRHSRPIRIRRKSGAGPE